MKCNLVAVSGFNVLLLLLLLLLLMDGVGVGCWVGGGLSANCMCSNGTRPLDSMRPGVE